MIITGGFGGGMGEYGELLGRQQAAMQAQQSMYNALANKFGWRSQINPAAMPPSFKRPEPDQKFSIREEMQVDVDEWLKDAI